MTGVPGDAMTHDLAVEAEAVVAERARLADAVRALFAEARIHWGADPDEYVLLGETAILALLNPEPPRRDPDD